MSRGVVGAGLWVETASHTGLMENNTPLDAGATGNVVWVPADGTGASLRIAPGSGVVSLVRTSGSDAGDADVVEIGFEGNLYGAGNLAIYADRVHHAWGREMESYPTVARMRAPADALVSVGNFDPVAGRVVVDEGGLEVLGAWIGTTLSGLDDSELLSTDFRHQEFRALQHMLASTDLLVQERALWWAKEHSIAL